MAKQLKNEQRKSLEDLFQALKVYREQTRTALSEAEARTHTLVDRMGMIQTRMDALAEVLGMPEGASRE